MGAIPCWFNSMSTNNFTVAIERKKSTVFFNHFVFWSTDIIKNVSSSTSHKKTPSLRLSVFPSLRLSVCTRIYEPCNPSPNDFPTLCDQFSARFPLKGRGARRFPLLRFDLIFGYASIPIIPTFFA